MDSHSIRSDALYLLMLAAGEAGRANEAKAMDLRYRASALFAQADHLDRTGHYIELPAHIGSSVGRSLQA